MTDDDRRASLRAAVRGVRAFVLDADGVIFLKSAPLPGAVEALAAFDAAGVPFRVVTNFSSLHRTTLARGLERSGIRADPAHLITAASAAATHTAAAFPGRPIFVLAAPDALREFDGQWLLGASEAAGPDARAAAVVIGDAGDDLSFANLDAAFRLVRSGAEFLAMHRSPWWITAKGPTLDSGAAVAGLEYALGRRATVLGKPSPVVFRQALDALAGALGERRIRRHTVAMVGDDLRTDLVPAHRLGLRTILTLTGKVSPGAETDAIARARFSPDAIAGSLAEIAELVTGG